MTEVRQQFVQGNGRGVIHDQLLKNILLFVGALCIILWGSVPSFAASSDSNKRTSLDVGGPGGVNISDGFFIQLPFNGSRNVNSGYSPSGGSKLHKTKNRTCCVNDYYALDLGLVFEPVLAVASGQVVYAGPAGGGNNCDKSWKGYGRLIIIDHGNGFQSNYAHLKQVQVTPGQWVNQGDQIAISGNSSCQNGQVQDGATGAHLHFAMYKNANISGNGVTSLGGPYGGNSALPEPFSGYYGIRQGDCLSQQLPSLCINGRDFWTTQQRKTDTFKGSGYTAGGVVQRIIILPNGNQITASSKVADSFGNVSWRFTPDCQTPTGTYTLWAVDQQSGKSSNAVTEVITPGRCRRAPTNSRYDFFDSEAKVFTLSGELIFYGKPNPERFVWNDQLSSDVLLPNGVYLYVITTRREDGTILKSEVKKLIILR